MIAVAQRLQGVQEYYFSKKLREIDELNKNGKAVINLGIGSPDLPPHADVIETLNEVSRQKEMHGYQSYKGLPVFRNAIADWYQRSYKVSLNPDTEILPLMGSKEGIMHICMTYLNPGDVALVPDPGYPTYASNIALTGAKAMSYKLTEANDWMPDFAELENEDLSKVKLLFVNYTQMPTGKAATPALFERIVTFSRKHNILVVHDNPYSFILNDKPLSIMSVPDAKDIALELNSLSKAYNMAGWRIGMLVGAKERIDEVLRFKSNMDSGMFAPLQFAAAKALSLGAQWHRDLNIIYGRRREHVYAILDFLQCTYDKSQTGLFVWAKVPDKYNDGYQLSDFILYKAGVFLTPGGIFGKEGDKYIRISLCGSENRFSDALTRIKKI